MNTLTGDIRFDSWLIQNFNIDAYECAIFLATSNSIHFFLSLDEFVKQQIVRLFLMFILSQFFRRFFICLFRCFFLCSDYFISCRWKCICQIISIQFRQKYWSFVCLNDRKEEATKQQKYKTYRIMNSIHLVCFVSFCRLATFLVLFSLSYSR